MDDVIRHRITVVVSKEAGPDGFGSVVQMMKTFSYADNGLLASTRPKWLQRVFNVLMELFDQVGMQENVRKMVGMVFQP